SSDLVPAASFNAAPMFGLAPLLVTFNDTSTGYITNRSWHFGDGSSTNTSAVTVSHLYANPGTNSVTLVVSGPFGTSTRTRPDYIIVTSTLSITDILLSGPDVLVSFTSQAGRSYRLEYADDPSSSVWLNATEVTATTGGLMTATHLGGANARVRFYRMRLLP